MDIYDLLHKDHETASKLIDILLDHEDVETREREFARLQEALRIHKQAEEEVFYTPLRSHMETREEVLESAIAHGIVEQLLRDLEAEDKTSEMWSARLHVLKDLVQHHVAEEENEMFKQARSIFSESEARNMASRFEQAKQRLH